MAAAITTAIGATIGSRDFMIFPPWLQFDPQAESRIKIAANQQRNNMAQAQLQAQIARERMMQEAQQQQDALAFKYREAADMDAYRREEIQRRREEAGATERFRQQKYEQEAQEASKRMQGWRAYQERVGKGEDPMKAFASEAHLLLWSDPAKLQGTLESMQRQAPPPAPIFGKTPEGVPFVQDPRTGHVGFPPSSTLKDPDAPTPALTTKLQTSLLQGEKAVQLGAQLSKQLKWGDVGAMGNVNRFVINEGLAQIFPGMAKDSVADAQSLLGNFNEKAVAAITASGDKRVSNADMARYQKMLPKAGPGESLGSAKTKIKAFMDELRTEAAKDAKRLGQPRPAWTLSKQEILGAYKAGQMSDEDTEQLLRTYHTD